MGRNSSQFAAVEQAVKAMAKGDCFGRSARETENGYGE